MGTQIMTADGPQRRRISADLRCRTLGRRFRAHCKANHITRRQFTKMLRTGGVTWLQTIRIWTGSRRTFIGDVLYAQRRLGIESSYLWTDGAR